MHEKKEQASHLFGAFLVLYWMVFRQYLVLLKYKERRGSRRLGGRLIEKARLEIRELLVFVCSFPFR